MSYWSISRIVSKVACVFNSLTDPPEFNNVSSDAVVVEGDPSITL